MATASEVKDISASELGASNMLPRIAIKYCTQCKWMLRAAYFAQELLSTFGTSIGEIALQPATGGTFTVTISFDKQRPSAASSIEVGEGDAAATITTAKPESSESRELGEVLLWDRKRDGGFPDTKQLKSLVRNIIEPNRNLGHVDRALAKEKEKEGSGDEEKSRLTGASGIGATNPEEKVACEDCK